MDQLTQLNSWTQLKHHAKLMQSAEINELKNDSFRSSLLVKSSDAIQVNFNNQLVNDVTLDLLISLAKERNLSSKIKALMHGEIVNISEYRPALHTALRVFDDNPIIVDGCNIIPVIQSALAQMQDISMKIRSGSWVGFSGKPITDIVNIGIGGSDLGPRMCIKALSHLTAKHLKYHFISDMDPYAFANLVASLNPETTLFIVSSKSFKTKETLYHAQKALKWINNPDYTKHHFIAVTANPDKAKEFGITHIVPIWDWVGGRFSLCSAINLITVIAIGYKNFTELLAGANAMDTHFHDQDLASNIPVLLALISIWNNNFLDIHNLLMLVYAQQLEYIVPYFQQLDMESNGKSLDNSGRPVNYATGPILWGGLGNQVQHSYYQLLCQGTHKISIDFLTINQFKDEPIHQMFEAKKRVLTQGIQKATHPGEIINGNKPLNHIQLADCTPFSLGQLVALYEHKIYVQAVIWDINPFDQPGVESAKRISNAYLGGFRNANSEPELQI